MKIKLKDTLDTDLWKRDLYTLNIDYIIGSNIYEYDIKNAGLNLSIYYNLLDDSTIDYLKGLDKSELHRHVGLLQRDNPKFNKTLTASFSKMRKNFFIVNNVHEKDVLSIKKDAIFLINKQCEELKFGNIEFVVKNRFTSFHKFDNYEFYYRNRGNIIAVKGISDDRLELHEDYMLLFLKEIFNLLETSDNRRVVNKIKTFASMYKNKKLPNGYYRELNTSSMFNLTKGGTNITIKSEYVIPEFNIDHTYNYMTYILRLIQRYFFISNT